MIEVGLNLDSVGCAIDERGHGGCVGGNSIVVEVFSVDALHHVTRVLFTCCLNVDGKGPSPALLLIGLVGPLKVIFGSHEGAGVVPKPRATLPRSVPGIEPGIW